MQTHILLPQKVKLKCTLVKNEIFRPTLSRSYQMCNNLQNYSGWSEISFSTCICKNKSCEFIIKFSTVFQLTISPTNVDLPLLPVLYIKKKIKIIKIFQLVIGVFQEIGRYDVISYASPLISILKQILCLVVTTKVLINW